MSTIFRRKLNFPNKIIMYINPLYAVAAGLVGLMDNNLIHKLMQKLGSQFCRLGVLFCPHTRIDGQKKQS